MTDEERASVVWLTLVEHRGAGGDERIIDGIFAHLAAVRRNERAAERGRIVAFLRARHYRRASSRALAASAANAIERGEHAGESP